uniref:DDE Tnp4 domain-containing protein n=1 Tax=Heliothis virescens TaxID=7102 RepID=A0A2A4KB39_HELVI
MRPSLMRLRFRILALSDAQDRRRRLVAQRRKMRAMNRATLDAIVEIPDAEFIRTFRLGKSDVTELLTPLLNNQRRKHAISPNLKILIALSFYATGSNPILVGQSALPNVSQTIVSRVVRQVDIPDAEFIRTFRLGKSDVRALTELLTPLLNNQCRKHAISPNLKVRNLNVPRKSHLQLLQKIQKGYLEVNMWLTLKLAQLEIPMQMKQILIALSFYATGSSPTLIGQSDSGYPLRTTMMTPILNTVEGTPEHYYYQLHVTARNTHRALYRRRARHYAPVTAGKIVNAFCVLHNMANKKRLSVPSLTPAEEAFTQRQRPVTVDAVNEEEIGAQTSQRANPDLQQGRQLQRALIESLWRERQN